MRRGAGSYGHAVLLAELPNAEPVHGGGHLLEGQLQVLRVALDQGRGDPTAAVLQHRHWGLDRRREVRHRAS